jgi:cation diffusion facilitator family transporter
VIDQRCIRCGQKVPWVTFCGNIFLTIYKGLVGYIGGSNALIADAFHSFTDIIGTSVILLSVRISSRPPDQEHPYGHGKAEFMSAAFIYLVLTILAGLLFSGGLIVILKWELHPPNFVTLLGAAISVLANVAMYNFGRCAGTRNDSPALLANAFENRADALSSVAVVIGIALAIFVHPICDSLAAMSVGIIIFINCVIQIKAALRGLMDKALPPTAIWRIKQAVLQHEGVTGVSFVKSRAVGPKYWIDLGIHVPKGTVVSQAQAIASSIRNSLLRQSKHFYTVEVFVSPDPVERGAC